jgi:hypothetical protein
VVRLTVDDDCNVSVILLQAIGCSPPFSGEWVVTEGRVSVYAPCKPSYGYCEPPFECAPASAPAGLPSAPSGLSALATQPCACPPPQPLCREVVRALADNQYYHLSDNCDVTITLEAYCSLQSNTVDHQLKAPKVTVNYQTCENPPPQSTAAANPFPTCVRDCSPLPDEACAVRDATPAPLLHPLWGYDCTLDVETSCVDGSSGRTETRIAFVNVGLEQCSGPAGQ